MLVQQILASKGDGSVVTVAPDVQIAEAVKILSERKIGTVVVSQDGRTAEGILSERDVVRELAKNGGACLDQPVSAYMTRNLKTAKRADKVDDILSAMTEGRFRHMPIVEEGVLLGIVTLGDVVKARLSEVAMEKDALEGMIMGH